MKPAIPPLVVRLVCSKAGMTLKEQAAACNLQRQQLAFLTMQDWDRWKVATAEKWCSACGFDLWDLRLTEQQAATVNWAAHDAKTQLALEKLFEMRSPGQPKPQRRWFLELAKTAKEVFGCQHHPDN